MMRNPPRGAGGQYERGVGGDFSRQAGSYSKEKMCWIVSVRPGPGSRSASMA